MALPWHESKLIIPVSLTLVFHSHPKREQIQRPREKDVRLCLEVFLFSNGDLTAKPQRPVLTKGISETLSELLAPRNLFLGVQPSQHLVPRNSSYSPFPSSHRGLVKKLFRFPGGYIDLRKQGRVCGGDGAGN